MRLTTKQARAMGIVIPRGTKTKKGPANDTLCGRNVLFDQMCVQHGIQIPVSEYLFHPTRQWRFDYCWPEHDLFLEVQGGLFTGGRHVQGAALLKEHEKLNEASVLGWRPIFCQPKDVETGAVFALIKRAIEGS